jgi:hypothetical protein
MLFSDLFPADNESLRHAIYAGHIFKLAPCPASLSMITSIKQRLEDKLKLPLEKIHMHMDTKEFSAPYRELKKSILGDPFCRTLITDLISHFGFRPQDNAFDHMRLRAIFHQGHANPHIERAYAVHRDTWFGNPQCQINWWLPLFDTAENQAFSFYPSCFDQPIENGSSAFDYDTWMATLSINLFDYPKAFTMPPDHERQSFSCRAGEIILFSAAHAHQTNRNETGLTRFSIDFRTAHLDDHAAHRGAPNADNGSRPDALKDYIFPAERRAATF